MGSPDWMVRRCMTSLKYMCLKKAVRISEMPTHTSLIPRLPSWEAWGRGYTHTTVEHTW